MSTEAANRFDRAASTSLSTLVDKKTTQPSSAVCTFDVLLQAELLFTAGRIARMPVQRSGPASRP